MIPILAFATLAVVLIIVLVVAYHLIGIYVALKRGADHLESLGWWPRRHSGQHRSAEWQGR